ncbi:MAG: DEAD/DEAH box helicase [Desulfobacterales bacterium]|nr:DEAD/DEAH box helicase [Desulfobacterales bacterium]
MIEIPRARYVGGTIVLDNIDQDAGPPDFFQWYQDKWRCPAFHYRTVRTWLKEHSIRNIVPRWQNLNISFNNSRQPHAYQTEALNVWTDSGCWGSVVLPTGAGKTLLALKAIVKTSVSALVIVPTIDLVHQWYACLDNAFGKSIAPIGVWYGLEKEIRPVTVTTYHSAWSNAEEFGNQFKLLIFDEIHHLPAPSWHEIALMNAAPFRLGLTATYPESDKQNQKSKIKNQKSKIHLLDEIVGPVVYKKSIDELTGKQLAQYRTQRIRVNLNEQEQAAYDAAHAVYMGYVRETRLRESYGPAWWDEFTRRSAYDPGARRAKVAELKLKEIVNQAKAKLDILEQLLREHHNRQMLIFTAHNRFAYSISRQYLIPVITHQTKAAERKTILENFQSGAYRVIVTTRVLNEGVDVPAAKIAVVLGGTAGAREYIQRLGRVLRKQDNIEAVLYEVIARKTVDEGIAQRRKPAM